MSKLLIGRVCVYISNLYLYIHVAFVFGKESLKIPPSINGKHCWKTEPQESDAVIHGAHQNVRIIISIHIHSSTERVSERLEATGTQWFPLHHLKRKSYYPFNSKSLSSYSHVSIQVQICQMWLICVLLFHYQWHGMESNCRNIAQKS